MKRFTKGASFLEYYSRDLVLHRPGIAGLDVAPIFAESQSTLQTFRQFVKNNDLSERIFRNLVDVSRWTDGDD
ncbi:hypothetical protein KPH14_010235 [Odynerus spinipes]|uniref:Uncharacterized protein n=1 Tax=Odynerus spinipes TaxID=1348599 RepID=A0AAD9RUS2_9HYME|nr:hypothetical protein KPH14_010235 [Odynerus spinipes]